jgi:glutathione synthase/RimK-type ligase-like ATP-grasp enzyme
MNLLILTNSGESLDGFDEFFDTVDRENLEKAAPEAIKGHSNVIVGDTSITSYDAAFLQIPSSQAVFGRVLLEIMEEQQIAVNYPSTAFFTMAKKNYLYYVLHQKNVNAPKTVVTATEKSSRNIQRQLKGPLIGRRFDNIKESETELLQTVEEIEDFTDGVEYEDSLLIFHEYAKGDKYRCLVIGDQVISLADETDGSWVATEGLQYSSLAADTKKEVKRAANSIGAPLAEVLVIDGKVYDVNPRPDLDMYTDISGKNAYKMVSDVLRGD